MQNESEISALTSDSEAPIEPLMLTRDQSRELLRSIIAEALQAVEELKDPEVEYSASDFGYAIHLATMGCLEAIGQTEAERSAMLCDYLNGGIRAQQDFLQDRHQELKRRKMH